MTQNDLASAMRLKEQAGWNQTEMDWRRFLSMEPAGCFVAEWDGRLVGTTATCILGSVAWVAMVLVDPDFRGRGIGKALMSHALCFLDTQSVPSVRLDATAMGKPLYEKLGFVVEYELTRFEGVPKPLANSFGNVENVGPKDWPELFQLDHQTTRADRTKFLSRLFSERPEEVKVVRSEGKMSDFLAGRPGTRAWQVGPCLATAEAGPALFANAACRFAGERIFIDIPIHNQVAAGLAEQMGLTIQRRLVRMRRGRPVSEQSDRIWASSGPELG
jgi:GNAT superfamily N-acetyltransferase